ncbi:uncharacterized protein BDR25DRAFT_48897 [Lindgomyces ingoldianus]|uniref:Uncharacterized protein n=1 Tax=Lindgomyces ingoldianus TaxID=673940 RepID=A0ACB6QSW3_9PLEO|nr:uncharacterized protein BDR25DRAFT_48897 [Lindgomyces ingoldianus]KAF2469392.1 hypothetical protein BDR25DRAFT_48897 [Lindgomyces ingoldianus]
MPIQLSNLNHDQDWPELGCLLFKSSANVYHSFFNSLHPIPNTTSKNREEYIRISIAQVKSECISDPTSHTLKAVNIETGKIVGGALLNIYIKNKPTNTDDQKFQSVGSYACEGEGEYVILPRTIKQSQISRAGLTDQPHIFLYAIATDLEHQYDGDEAAQLLLNWGIERASSLGIELWAYTTSPNVELYKAHGFELTNEMIADPGVADVRQQCETEGRYRQFTFWSWRRPAVRNREMQKQFYLDTEGFW